MKNQQIGQENPDNNLMKTDSLKLVDMMWLDEEISACLPLRRAWGEEEIFLDYWGRYDQVFDERPDGSISSGDLLQPEEEGTFLLLRSEHVDRIIKSLNSHIDELSMTTREQLGTLEKWKSLSLATHRNMVAYIFARDEERGATAVRAQPLTAGDAAVTIIEGERDQPSDVAASRSKTGLGIKSWAGTSGKERLAVKTLNRQFVSLILLAIIMVPLGSLLFISELAKGSKLAPAMLLIGLTTLIMFGVVVWLFRRGYLKSVKYFSDAGLVCNDGKSFAWTDLSRVVDRTRHNRATNFKGIWRIEIQFKNGESAWLLPTKISNFSEVHDLVRSLPCEHTEVRA
ncbi:MAG: hypothetical protein WCD76_11275 [Pyrinomonadaceae bacterium]